MHQEGVGGFARSAPSMSPNISSIEVRLLEAVEEKREFEDRRLWKRIESNSPQAGFEALSSSNWRLGVDTC